MAEGDPDTMNDLRAELLLGRPVAVPEYSLVLPNGWEELTADAASERDLMDRAARRLREQHRPDLLAQARAMSGRAFAGLRSADAQKIYVQTEAWADDLVLPMSITTTLRTAPTAAGLDDQVATLIRTQGATALHDDKRFVRWVSDSEIAMGTATVGQHTVAYLTPVPGSARMRALQLTAVIVHPTGAEYTRAHPLISGMELLADSIASTLSWHAA